MIQYLITCKKIYEVQKESLYTRFLYFSPVGEPDLLDLSDSTESTVFFHQDRIYPVFFLQDLKFT